MTKHVADTARHMATDLGVRRRLGRQQSHCFQASRGRWLTLAHRRGRNPAVNRRASGTERLQEPLVRVCGRAASSALVVSGREVGPLPGRCSLARSRCGSCSRCTRGHEPGVGVLRSRGVRHSSHGCRTGTCRSDSWRCSGEDCIRVVCRWSLRDGCRGGGLNGVSRLGRAAVPLVA